MLLSTFVLHVEKIKTIYLKINALPKQNVWQKQVILLLKLNIIFLLKLDGSVKNVTRDVKAALLIFKDVQDVLKAYFYKWMILTKLVNAY